MADFSSFSNYDPNSAFNHVVFGGDSPVLEVELNELQMILRNKIHNLLNDYFNSGFIKPSGTAYTFDQPSNTITLPMSVAVVFGNRAVVANWANSASTDNKIALGSLPASGTQNALVFLELWSERVHYNTPLDKYGNINGVSQTNTIEDSRIAIETSQRNQTQYRIRVVQGAQNITDAGVNAQGPLTTPSTTAFTVSPSDSGLFIATNANFNLGNGIDNNIYAIPMFTASMSTTATTITDKRVRSTILP